jgi:N-acetyl-anhydromuramyl-L-alanine amidase AmpD
LVWVSFAVSMTLVGAMLGVLGSGGRVGIEGLTLPPMASISGGSSLESILHNEKPLDRQRWRAIVIHHSGAPFGSAASLTAQAHRADLSGLGYHFLIGNGSGMGDGDIHVGYRWLDQLPGAHAVGTQAEEYNQHAIGICLIGDGNRRPFSDLQIQRLAELVAALARELDIPADRILLQSDIAETASPGRYFPEASFREYLDGLL